MNLKEAKKLKNVFKLNLNEISRERLRLLIKRTKDCIIKH